MIKLSLTNKGLNSFSDLWKSNFNSFMIGFGDESKGRMDSVSECCVRAGVPDHCVGLCMAEPWVVPMSRSLGKRINACTKYDKDIQKCWQPILANLDITDKIGEFVMQIFPFIGSCTFNIFYSLSNRLNLVWFVFHSFFIRQIWAICTSGRSEACFKGKVSTHRATWTQTREQMWLLLFCYLRLQYPTWLLLYTLLKSFQNGCWRIFQMNIQLWFNHIIIINH